MCGGGAGIHNYMHGGGGGCSNLVHNYMHGGGVVIVVIW